MNVLDALVLHFDELGFDIINNVCPTTFTQRATMFPRNKTTPYVCLTSYTDEPEIVYVKVDVGCDRVFINVDMTVPNSIERVESLINEALTQK